MPIEYLSAFSRRACRQVARRVLRDVGLDGGDEWWSSICFQLRKPVTDDEIVQSGWTP